jgi:outer membrane immunogenic protein
MLFASAALSAAMLPLGAANAADPLRAVPFNWSGFYAGIHGGWLNGDVNVHEEYEPCCGGGSISGSVLGVLAGVNFFYPPAAPWLLGVEADLGWAGVHGTGAACQEDCASDYLYIYDLNWIGHLRVRASYPMMGGATPFVAAGLAVADLKISQDCIRECEIYVPEGGVFFGGTVGAGLDFNAAQNVTLRGEVLYDFFHTKQYDEFSVDFSAWIARLALIWQLQ